MDRYDSRTDGLPVALAAIVYEHAGYINPYYRQTLGGSGTSRLSEGHRLT